MDWLAFGLGVLSITAVPLAWVVVYIRRRRHRGFILHNTTPPTPNVTSGQRR